MRETPRTRFALFDGVVASRDIVEPELSGFWGRGKPGMVDGKPAVLKGTHGVVMEVFENTHGLAVEFFDADGETIDVAFLDENHVRPETPEEAKATAELSARLSAEPYKLGC